MPRTRLRPIAAGLLGVALASGLLTVPLPAAGDAGELFTRPAVTVGGTAVPTVLRVLAEPSGAEPGSVGIGDGGAGAIPLHATGAMEIPETVEVDGRVYRITSIEANAFRDAVGITSTGLASNTSVTRIGDHAFARADALADTGLAANETVTRIGVGAFQSIQGLRDGALPASLEEGASTPFGSVVNLRTAYLPASLDEALRVGVKHAVDVYFRAGSEGWSTDDATFRALSFFGAEPAQLIPLGAVDVAGGTAALAGGITEHPYRAATGLFAAAGTIRAGEPGRPADVVTVTAADPEAFEGWRAEGVGLSAEQLAAPTVTFPMPAGNVRLSALDGTVVPTETPRPTWSPGPSGTPDPGAGTNAGGQLGSTGGALPWVLVVLAVVLTAGGVTLVMPRRHRAASTEEDADV